MFLGNYWVVADAAGTAVQLTNYRPFGMPFGGNHEGGVQPYKYNGKEFDTMNGINQYDFHARQQDPASIRFTSVDPLAEKYYSWSPYAYVGNNPIRFTDPTGMWRYEPKQDIPEEEPDYKSIQRGLNNIIIATKYVNDKGETINESEDGLPDVIVVPDYWLGKHQKAFDSLINSKQVDDPEMNKSILHPIGYALSDWKNHAHVGYPTIELNNLGYQAGYSQGYNDENTIILSVVNFFIGGSNDGTLSSPNSGYSAYWFTGKRDGKSDRKSGK